VDLAKYDANKNGRPIQEIAARDAAQRNRG
jgi:hypothetical protein